jgi:signal transduction histidine kinase
MHALRLKTKLVLAITAMVTAIVAILSTRHISEVVQQLIDDTNKEGTFIGREVFEMSRDALKANVHGAGTDTDLNDPRKIDATVEQILKRDAGVKSLLKSVLSDSPTIFDVAVTNTQGMALLHTNIASQGTVLERREDFSSFAQAGTWKQLKVIYGPNHVYDVRMPLTREGTPFGEVRVGVSTVLLKSQLQPLLNNALWFAGSAIILCMILSAGMSHLALRPLAVISHRLDLVSSGELELLETPLNLRSDEIGAVTNKIDRLGRQMRDVKEVFSAMKENVDQMMSNLQDGVMLFTSDFRAVLVSASTERFIGKPRSEMMGCHPDQIFSQDSRLGQAVLRAFETRQRLAEEDVETESGHHLEIALDFIEEHGERIGALLTFRDAESVHRIEDEIELSRRLSSIGRLTSGVAHEVKNPINAIVLHLEVLRQKLRDVDPDTRRHMDVIGSEIKRLDRVVQTLVDFTRPVELRLVEIDLRKLVDDVVMLASPEAAQRSVRIQKDTGPRPLRVHIDADLVKQAVLNIVINGAQAMPGGGTIYVAASREGESALITVRDEGPGIPPDVRDKIFNLYFTTKEDGTGIGLAVAYRILQLHHGSVEFDSVEGHGAIFYLRLPVSEGAASAERIGMSSGDPVKTT